MALTISQLLALNQMKAVPVVPKATVSAPVTTPAPVVQTEAPEVDETDSETEVKELTQAAAASAEASLVMIPNAIESVQQTDGPANFKAHMDDLDALIVASNGITSLTLDNARGHVMAVSKELMEHPEYDGLIIDRDLHNIMMFVRASRASTDESYIAKASKKAKAESNKAKASKITLNALDSIGLPELAAPPKQKQITLGALAGIDFDSIAAKANKR